MRKNIPEREYRLTHSTQRIYSKQDAGYPCVQGSPLAVVHGGKGFASMTQFESARKGVLTDEMHYVAKREDLAAVPAS